MARTHRKAMHTVKSQIGRLVSTSDLIYTYGLTPGAIDRLRKAEDTVIERVYRGEPFRDDAVALANIYADEYITPQPPNAAVAEFIHQARVLADKHRPQSRQRNV